MTMDDLPRRWADQFGLAWVPLFERETQAASGNHLVLLDGGFGSFALSVTVEQLWRAPTAANWAWSSNLPHHVTVTESTVAVTRWDRETPEVLSLSSVEARIEQFYTYLATDRVRSTRRVVDHVLNLFRRMRSLVAEARIPDERSIDSFLAFLSYLIEQQNESASVQIGLQTEEGQELLRALPARGLEVLTEDVLGGNAFQSFRLFPSLAVRHAGSEIFQEAHFELLRTPAIDLFGYAGPAEAKHDTRGGAHFTPVALARTIVEQTLLQVENLEGRSQLVLLDPACGSGAFLHEAIRTLRRLDFAGQLVIVGRDISRAAVSMAEFVVRHAANDWSPRREIVIDLQTADSLQAELPRADVILTNPPFIAWSALDSRQRDQMRQVLGDRLRGRGDISMAFITRAIDILAPGGALGVLLPSSLLTLESAEAWRADLLEQTDLRLLASLGDYGLFAYALVQVAAAVFARPSAESDKIGTTRALVTTNSSEATGNALRTLRRLGSAVNDVGEEHAWRLFKVPTTIFNRRPTWRLTSPKTEAVLSRLLDGGARRVDSLFEVKQGVRTGMNEVFLLRKYQFDELPAREKRFFRPAVMNDSIQDGTLQELFWVFYPYSANGPRLETRSDLLSAVPTYAKRYLLPNREALERRANIVRDDRADWWGLSERRATWALERTPRLISKYFGGPGGFSIDLGAHFIIVQGFAWFPKLGSEADLEEDGSNATLSIETVLCAYAALMNSRRFSRVLELFSPHVAGGQFDLSPRYVDHIPIPNLAELARDDRVGRLIAKLAELGRRPRMRDAEWQVSADRITTELYGSDFFDEV